MKQFAAILLALSTTACSTGSVSDASSACEEAADTVELCTGDRPTPPTQCDGETEAAAQFVVDNGCEALEPGKADWSFSCSAWVRWLGTCDVDADQNTAVIEELNAQMPQGTFSGTGYWGHAIDRDNGDPRGVFGACEVSIETRRDDRGTRLVVEMSGDEFENSDAVRFELNDYDRMEVSEWEQRLGTWSAHVHYIPDETFTRYESRTLSFRNDAIRYDHADEIGRYAVVVTTDKDYSCLIDLR